MRNSNLFRWAAAGLIVIGSVKAWEYNFRAMRAHEAMRRLQETGEANKFCLTPTLPGWLDRGVPDWLSDRFPHLFSVPRYVEFFPGYTRKTDFAVLRDMPSIEEVDIVDSRVAAVDLGPLRYLPKLQVVRLRGTRIRPEQIPGISRGLPGVIVTHDDIDVSFIGHPEDHTEP